MIYRKNLAIALSAVLIVQISFYGLMMLIDVNTEGMIWKRNPGI